MVMFFIISDHCFNICSPFYKIDILLILYTVTKMFLFIIFRIVRFYHIHCFFSMVLCNLFKYFCLSNNLFVSVITFSSFECQDYNIHTHTQSWYKKAALSQNGTELLFCPSTVYSIPVIIQLIICNYINITFRE